MTLKWISLIFAVASAPVYAEEASSPWSVHGQMTAVSQGDGNFYSPYSGKNSLPGQAELKTSFTATLFLGRELWKGGQIYVNPELSAGEGLGQTLGIAAFPNGEIYRVDTPTPKLNLSRLYLKQVFGLGGGEEHLEEENNRHAATVDRDRLTLIGGKFSLNDFFDDNTYSHDPRSQFLNWALMDQGAWDYAADTRGYTWGVYAELREGPWAARFAIVLEPAVANQLEFDTNVLQAHGDNAEVEYRYAISGHPGAARLLGYANHAHMGSYQETIDTPSAMMDIANTRAYRTKYGLGLSLEQEVARDVGLFARLGWNDGTTETWAFTEIDRSASFGASVGGSYWSRPADRLGAAYVWSGLSDVHAEYLSLGGYGFLIGDGKLSYAPEQVLETYYLYMAGKHIGLSADFQFVVHPAYNQDRGPVAIGAGRIHYEF